MLVTFTSVSRAPSPPPLSISTLCPSGFNVFTSPLSLKETLLELILSLFPNSLNLSNEATNFHLLSTPLKSVICPEKLSLPFDSGSLEFPAMTCSSFSLFAPWSYTIKVDRKLCVIICLLRHKNERT
ncbi:hypothetical protein ET006_07940, partial [Lactococcus garvieae]|nr:hypothetical protein [Lactococcus garvieae]